MVYANKWRFVGGIQEGLESRVRLGLGSALTLVKRALMMLAQSGRGIAVLLAAAEFESMQQRLEVLKDVYRAEEQLAAGEGIPHEQARAQRN